MLLASRAVWTGSVDGRVTPPREALGPAAALGEVGVDRKGPLRAEWLPHYRAGYTEVPEDKGSGLHGIYEGSALG